MSEQTSNLGDLNKVLFDQLNRLNVDGLKGSELEEEISRSNALTSVSKEIVSNARTVLDGAKIVGEYQGLTKEDKQNLLAKL